MTKWQRTAHPSRQSRCVAYALKAVSMEVVVVVEGMVADAGNFDSPDKAARDRNHFLSSRPLHTRRHRLRRAPVSLSSQLSMVTASTNTTRSSIRRCRRSNPILSIGAV